MKRNATPCGLTLIILIGFALSGCSYSVGSIGHNIVTRVDTSQNNYRVVNSVTGEAKHDYYFFVLGGPSSQNLLDQARRDMIKKARLIGKPRAVINVTTDIKMSWFLWWSQKTAYVSGDVIEFFGAQSGEKHAASERRIPPAVSYVIEETIEEAPPPPPPVSVAPEPKSEIVEASPDPGDVETAGRSPVPAISEPPPVPLAMEESPRATASVEKIARGNLNIRGGPSASFDKVGMVGLGQTVFVLEEKEDWARIGKDRWVSARFLEPMKRTPPAVPVEKPSSATLAPEPAASKEESTPEIPEPVIPPAAASVPVLEQPKQAKTDVGEWIANANLIIRTGPASTFNDVGMLKSGDRANVIEKKGKWARIGEDRWVIASALRKSGSEKVETVSGEMFEAMANIRIRPEPSTTSEARALLKKGDRVQVVKRTNGWAKIGPDQWVSERYLKKAAN